MKASRAALGLAMLAVVATTAGCAAWKMNTAKELARRSEPFQSSPPQPRQRWLVVGDSTAVGTGASAPERSVAGLVAAAAPGTAIVNLANDGARYADFAAQLQGAQGRFDTVLVLGGGNDVIRLTGEERLRADILRVAQLARQKADRVILMPPGNVGNAPFFFAPLSWWMDRRSVMLHDAVKDAAQVTGASYVRLYRDKASDPFAQRPRELHADDGLHPSDAGYRFWMQELVRQAGAVAG